MIKQAGVDFNKLKEDNYDSIMGKSTGAGVIFGATGGVMEAALRSVADWLAGKDLKKIDYKSIRGMEEIKEADIKIGKYNLKILPVATDDKTEICPRLSWIIPCTTESPIPVP